MAKLYSEIRSAIRTGDLVSWDAGKVSSFFGAVLWLYQKILRTKSVHTGIVVEIGGRLFVAEARPPAVRLFPLSKMDDFWLLNLDLEEREEDYDLLLKDMGVPYGYLDLFKGVLGFKNSSKELYCSEQCTKFYVERGYFPEDVYDEAAQIPDNLVEVAERISGKKFVFVHIDHENLKQI